MFEVPANCAREWSSVQLSWVEWARQASQWGHRSGAIIDGRLLIAISAKTECQCVLRHFKTPEMMFGSLQITDSGPRSLSPFIVGCNQNQRAFGKDFTLGLSASPPQPLCHLCPWHATNWSKIDKILGTKKKDQKKRDQKYAVQLHWRLQNNSAQGPWPSADKAINCRALGLSYTTLCGSRQVFHNVTQDMSGKQSCPRIRIQWYWNSYYGVQILEQMLPKKTD